MQNYVIPMPVLRPVRISTKNLSWWARLKQHFKPREWEIYEDYLLYLPWLEKFILAPKGFTFSASIPRIFWSLLNPTGILLIPSIFHDFGYQYNCLLDENRKIVYEGIGREFFDLQIREISVYVNNVHTMNNVIWGILRATAWVAWNSDRKENRNVREDFNIV